ncbi:MAG: hypothetical protein E5Y00_11070 [Mesorhizobium sp.]|nr:MAG: hypothetical protein E5Y00_11070 [Mesorhizobium sp.]
MHPKMRCYGTFNLRFPGTCIKTGGESVVGTQPHNSNPMGAVMDEPSTSSRKHLGQSGLPYVFLGLVLGLTLGAAISLALFVGPLDRVSSVLDLALRGALPALAMVGGALVLAVPFTWLAVRIFLKRTQGTLETVVSDAASAARAALQRDTAHSIMHFENAAHEFVAWYGPAATRRWVARTAIAVLISFGGLVGTALLFRQILLLTEQNNKLDKQIDLLAQQNQKLDLQTLTAEAQRRSGLATELFEILQEVSKLVAEPRNPTLRPQLTRGLENRIVTLSRAATPYWTIEVAEDENRVPALAPQRAERARSPERGQLFTGLVLAGIDIETLAKAGATFSSADLRGAILPNVLAKGVDLRFSDLAGAIMHDADLTNANLSGAQLAYVGLARAKLSGSSITGASADWANFTDADLTKSRISKSSFVSAHLQRTKLDDAQLADSDFTDAYLRGASLQRALFVDTNFHDADFYDANLEGALVTGWLSWPAEWELYRDATGNRRLRHVKDLPAK